MKDCRDRIETLILMHTLMHMPTLFFLIIITEKPSMAKPLGLSMETPTSGCWPPRNNQH